MKKTKKIAVPVLSLIMAAETALTAHAGGLEPVSIDGTYYTWKTGYAVLYAEDKDGNVLWTEGGFPDNEFDPVKYIEKLPELEYLGTQDTDNGETRLYSCGGGTILGTWETDARFCSNGKELLKKYPGGIFREGTLFCISGLVNIGGKTYYQDENGEKVTGWLNIGELQFYFDKNGEMVKKNTVIDGIRYKFSRDGACRGRFTGWTSSSKGKKYWKKGILLKNRRFTVGDKRYCADENGYVTEVTDIPYEQRVDGDFEGFISISETVNIDGKCYSRRTVGLDPKNDSDAKYLEEACGLSFDDLYGAELVGEGYVCGAFALNDFRLGDSNDGAPAAIYRIDESRVMIKHARHELYYIFEYSEHRTAFTAAAKALYAQWKGENSLNIKGITAVEYYGSRTDVYSVFLEVKAADSASEKKILDFLKENGIDEKFVSVTID